MKNSLFRPDSFAIGLFVIGLLLLLVPMMLIPGVVAMLAGVVYWLLMAVVRAAYAGRN